MAQMAPNLVAPTGQDLQVQEGEGAAVPKVQALGDL